MGKFIELTGKTFGRLTVISRSSGGTFWLCLCSCGRKATIQGSQMRKGMTKSCGCIRKETTARLKQTHQMCGTRFYNIWKGMNNRTNNPNNASYKHYGGRGIRCLWTNFDEFKRDMFDSYTIHCTTFSEKNTSIDRIEVNGHYSKDNCRWATRSIQSSNTRPRLLTERDFTGRFIKIIK